MTVDITNANNEVTEVYTQLKPLIEGVVEKNARSIETLVKKIKDNIDTLTKQELESYMLQLSIETYYFSKIKDMGILKQECALILMKEKQAEVFNKTTGTQVIRANQATIDTLDKQTVNIMYNAIANSLKSKLDEAHRLVNVLSSVLISRNAEAKLKGVRDDDENLHSNDV